MLLDAYAYSEMFSIGGSSMVAIQTDVETTDGYGNIFIETSNNKISWVIVHFIDENGAIKWAKPVSASSFEHIFDITDISTGWIRIKYARDFGTGGLTFWISAKK